MAQIPLQLSITNSELGTFRRCRRKWYLTYHRKLAKYADGGTGPMWIGNVIHAALEDWIKTGGDPVETVHDIYDMFLLTLDPEDTLQQIRAETMIKERDLAKIMVDGFLQWEAEEGLFADAEVIGAEQSVEVPSNVPGVTLKGKIDVRIKKLSDGRNVYLDWKTLGAFSKVLDTIDISEQFRFYAMLETLAGKRDGTTVDGGLIVMLRRVKRTATAKPPFYMSREVRFNKAELSSMWIRTHAMIEQIVDAHEKLDAGGDHRAIAYPTPSGDCTWDCDFLSVCSLFDDGSRVEEALEANYVVHNPLARYEEQSLAERAKKVKS